jgi:ribosome recycling factor
MSYQESIEKIKPEMDKIIDFLDRELSKIRTGTASSSLVEDVVVDCFGQDLPLKQLAAISTPEPRQILIQPWDDSYIPGIEKALERESIGVSPIVDGKIIRLSMPPMSEEYRKNLAKVISDKKENARQTVRRWRDEAWKDIQDSEKKGEITEDDKFKGKDKLQELVDEYNEKIENKVNKKEKEIGL